MCASGHNIKNTIGSFADVIFGFRALVLAVYRDEFNVPNPNVYVSKWYQIQQTSGSPEELSSLLEVVRVNSHPEERGDKGRHIRSEKADNKEDDVNDG